MAAPTPVRRRRWMYLALAAVAFLCYANALQGEFVYDDRPLLLRDPGSLGMARLWGHFTGAEGSFQAMGPYYRPLVAVTYALDNLSSKVFLGGLEPGPFHLTNVVIHVVASVLLLRALLLIVPQQWAAFLGALLFAVHPIHTEAVAWISGRTDSLCCVFYLAAFIAYVRYRREGRAWGLAWTLGWFACALLSKEMAVTFPAAVVLYDLTVGRSDPPAPRGRPVVYGSLFGLAAVFLVIRQLAMAHVPERESLLYFAGRDGEVVAATMLQTLPVYLRLLVAPVHLVYNYAGVIPDEESLFTLRALLAALLVVGLLTVAVGAWRKHPTVTFALLFFFLALAPVMNVVPGVALMGERYLYIPSIALSLLVAYGLSIASDASVQRGSRAVVGAVALLFAVLTVARNAEWKDNERLFRSAEGTPGTMVNVNRATLHAIAGRREEAATLYREALQIRRETPLAWFNLGMMHRRMGGELLGAGELDEAVARSTEALELMSEARAIDPQSWLYSMGLGRANQQLASVHHALAERDAERADVLLAQARNYEEAALADFARAVELEAPDPNVHFAAAMLANQLGRRAECRSFLEGLQAIAPGFNGSDAMLERLRAAR